MCLCVLRELLVRNIWCKYDSVLIQRIHEGEHLFKDNPITQFE